MSLEKSGYYISPLSNLILFYGNYMETYNKSGYFEITEIDHKGLSFLNSVFDFEFIGGL